MIALAVPISRPAGTKFQGLRVAVFESRTVIGSGGQTTVRHSKNMPTPVGHFLNSERFGLPSQVGQMFDTCINGAPSEEIFSS